jgi:hypothetical protein
MPANALSWTLLSALPKEYTASASHASCGQDLPDLWETILTFRSYSHPLLRVGAHYRSYGNDSRTYGSHSRTTGVTPEPRGDTPVLAGHAPVRVGGTPGLRGDTPGLWGHTPD